MGAAVNPNVRVRDQPRCPADSDLKHVLAKLLDAPGKTIGLVADVSKAHRRHRHRRKAWGLMAYLLLDTLYVNEVGTFGLGCASYWWSRLSGLVTRSAISLAFRDIVDQSLFADDVSWLASGRAGMEAIVVMLCCT